MAGAYIRDEVNIGDILDVAAPRGSFILAPGSGPVILLSAGIGATPVLAMLHALAAAMSPREVWWIHGAHDRGEHPFEEEVRARPKVLPNAHHHIRYSSPGPDDRPAVDFDAPGRVTVPVLRELCVPREADFYLCGPPAFMMDRAAQALWPERGRSRSSGWQGRTRGTSYGHRLKRQHEPPRIVGDLLAAEIAEKQARSIKHQLTIAKLPLAESLPCAGRGH